jgi:hypothetical protein
MRLLERLPPSTPVEVLLALSALHERQARRRLGQLLIEREWTDSDDVDGVALQLCQRGHLEWLNVAWVLVRRHLKPGVVRLMRVEPLIRMALLRPRVSRAARTAVFGLLADRAVVDTSQAEVCVTLLSEALDEASPSVRDRAIALLEAIATSYPRLPNPVTAPVSPTRADANA